MAARERKEHKDREITHFPMSGHVGGQSLYLMPCSLAKDAAPSWSSFGQLM